MSNQVSEQQYNIVQNKKSETESNDQNKTKLIFARILALKGVAGIGETDNIKIYLENTGEDTIDDLTIEVNVEEGVFAEPEGNIVQKLIPGEVAVSNWSVKSIKPVQTEIGIKAFCCNKRYHIEENIKILFVEQYVEKKLHMNLNNEWEILKDKSTLQDGNLKSLIEIPVKTSQEIKQNLFGVTAHIPRDCDEEEPFNVTNLLDGRKETGWASRSNRVPYPTLDEWILVDLKQKLEVSSIGLIPYWKGSGFPVNFHIESSLDGAQWNVEQKVIRFQLDENEKQNEYPKPVIFTFGKTLCRMIRIRFYKLDNYKNDFFCRPFPPYQVRLSGVEIYDDDGHNVLEYICDKAGIYSSSTDHAWYNTVDTIQKTWSALFELGVKWNRIGQWGDKCEWATVEKERGIYEIDPVLDEKITESVKNGVNIIMTLGYGNNLYQERHDPWEIGRVWEKGHPHFQTAPSNEEGIQGFINYCRFMVNYFKGRISWWEIWNEENGWFLPGSDPVKYGKLLKEAAMSIKEVEPDAKVMAGGTAGMAPNFLEKALEQGAGPYLDSISYHPYGRSIPENPSTYLDYWEDGTFSGKSGQDIGISNSDEEIDVLKQRILRFNNKLVIWENEMNWFAPGEPASDEFNDCSELTQAKYLARLFIMNSANNIGTVWWSLYNENFIQEWALIRSGSMKKTTAYFVLQRISTIFDSAFSTTDLEVQVEGVEQIKLYIFKNDVSQYRIAFWTPIEARDNFNGEDVRIIIQSNSYVEAECLDIIHGVKQKLDISRDQNNIIITGLKIYDYPTIICVTTSELVL